MIDKLYKTMQRVFELYNDGKITLFEYNFQMSNILTSLKYEVEK